MAASIAWSSYSLQWANPLWEMVLLDPGTEARQVQDHVQRIITNLADTATNVSDVSDEAFDIVAGNVEKRWSYRVCRTLWMGLLLAVDVVHQLGPLPWVALVLAALASRVSFGRKPEAEEPAQVQDESGEVWQVLGEGG